MPWNSRADATRHTKKADTKEKQDAWLSTANRVYKETGDDGAAVKAANSAVKHHETKLHVVRSVAHNSPAHPVDAYVDRIRALGKKK